MTTPLHSRSGFTYHALHAADTEELAASVRLRGRVDSGLAFTRKAYGPDSSSYKDRARGLVVRWHGPRVFSYRLRILTMPGLRWKFEAALAHYRASWQWMGSHPDALTDFYGVESNPAIYRAALRWMPRFQDGIRQVGPATVQTPVASYTFDTIENVLHHPPDVNAAWLDFSGPLTGARFEALRAFWEAATPRLVTVTSEAARWEPAIARAVARHGGIVEWLSRELSSAACIYWLDYAHPVPMTQVMFKRQARRRGPPIRETIDAPLSRDEYHQQHSHEARARKWSWR
jgi:hypothetical protein